MLRSLSHDKNVRYACIYLILLATDQERAVRELTYHVRETTLEVSQQEVGETTRRRNERKPVRAVPKATSDSATPKPKMNWKLIKILGLSTENSD